MLRQHLVRGTLAFSDTVWIAEKAERMLGGRERAVQSADVLKLVERSQHSSYDCEYVALAWAEGVKLVTGDKRLPVLFPGVAILLEDFA